MRPARAQNERVLSANLFQLKSARSLVQRGLACLQRVWAQSKTSSRESLRESQPPAAFNTPCSPPHGLLPAAGGLFSYPANLWRDAIWIMLWLCLVICGLVLTGCAPIERTLYRREVVSVPGPILATNVITRTNEIVLAPASTNALTGEVTPARVERRIEPEITYTHAPPTLVTNLVPRPELAGAIQAGGALPFPFAGAAALALGWAYSAYASVRNRRVGVALVQGIEAGREFLQSTPEGQKLDEQFKETLARHQNYAGVMRDVRTLLDRYVHDA